MSRNHIAVTAILGVWGFLSLILSGCAGWPPETQAPTIEAQDRAIAELEALHAAAVNAAFDRMDPKERRRIENDLTARGEDPRRLGLRFTAAGTVQNLSAPGFGISAQDLELPAQAPIEDTARAFASRYAALWLVAPETLRRAPVNTRRSGAKSGPGVASVEFRQVYRGLPVLGGQVVVRVREEPRTIAGLSGSFLPIGDLSVRPRVRAEAARELLGLKPGQRAQRPRLLIWSDYLSGGSAEARLAWSFQVTDEAGFAVHDVYVDAVSGVILGRAPVAAEALRRSLWDLRNQPSFGSETCQRWQLRPPWSFYPAELATCPAQCTACGVDVRDCALCTCAHPAFDPADCERRIWRYDEVSGCLADGSPEGEGPCDEEALALWTDAGAAYAYWMIAFGRDSWDGAGNWLWLKVNPDRTAFRPAGRAQPKYVDDDDRFDLVQVTIQDGAANPQLHGHELGHVLQFGSYNYVAGNSGFHAQGIDAMEHNADVHGFRYRDLPLSEGYRCGPDLDHYTRFRTAGAGQSNKFIGNCHAWLMTQDASPSLTHHGVEVRPLARAVYDQIWFRNLSAYFHTSHDYFDWWNDMITAAHDLYGYGAPYYSARAAADAIGAWTDYRGVGTGVRPEDRYATVGWRGAPRGPCSFYRYSGSTTGIFWRCYTPRGWTDRALFNDPVVDPAASEPAAAIRLEPPGKYWVYVFWRGIDNRIRYRRFDVDTFTIGPPQDLGLAHLTSDVPAVAPISESPTQDRLLIVYHPLANPSYYYSTYLGAAGPPTDLGPALDSDAPPSLVAYPYGDRIQFLRPDFELAPTPRHLRYASYTLDAGGRWTIPADNDLTAVYNADAHLPRNVVRTDQGVALAAYGLTPGGEKLRMLFVTLGDGTDGDRELWYATLTEQPPGSGLLRPGAYRAVPLAPITGHSSRSPGGIAPGVPGYPLWHLWSPQGKLYQSRTYSD